MSKFRHIFESHYIEKGFKTDFPQRIKDHENDNYYKMIEFKL